MEIIFKNRSKKTHMRAKRNIQPTQSQDAKPHLYLAAIFILLVLFVVPGHESKVNAETFKLGAQEAEELQAAEPVFTPRPVITEEMMESGIKAFCIARFEIASSGKQVVHLVSSTGSAEVDEHVLGTLRTWRFLPGKRGGVPVASVRKIRVELEVD
jgi:hypothetical protein